LTIYFLKASLIQVKAFKKFIIRSAIFVIIAFIVLLTIDSLYF